MDITCDNCSARHAIPEARLSDRGAKLKCPSCGVTLVIFPSEHVAMAVDAEPTTEDWSHHPLGPEPPSGNVPAEIKRLFEGEQIHPPGTEPPVQRLAVPRAPEGQLSVTPPPPRAARAPLTPASMLRATRPRSPIDAPEPPRRLTSDPPPRRVRRAPEQIAPPALLDDSPGAARASKAPANPAPTTSPPASEVATQPPAGERATPQHTSPGVRNRTGPTGGASPLRGPAPQQPQIPPMSYAPPWGASWNTNGTPGHPGYAWTPGAPPPWQPQPGAPQGTPVPQYGPPTGTPAPGFFAPAHYTGTPAPNAPASGPPMTTAWVPAVVLGMEKTTLILLLGVVMLVGLLGSFLGAGTSQLFAQPGPVYVRPAVVPANRLGDDIRRPRPVAPRPVPADRRLPVVSEPTPASDFDVEGGD